MTGISPFGTGEAGDSHVAFGVTFVLEIRAPMAEPAVLPITVPVC
jgi:hypothetical protein